MGCSREFLALAHEGRGKVGRLLNKGWPSNTRQDCLPTLPKSKLPKMSNNGKGAAKILHRWTTPFRATRRADLAQSARCRTDETVGIVCTVGRVADTHHGPRHRTKCVRTRGPSRKGKAEDGLRLWYLVCSGRMKQLGLSNVLARHVQQS
ncbi:hypothetical protein BT67DRAFT_439578 [Trichocladium antarcticum]|uniref:Uncharacterized protein n=1 Tax=Trichocladium antarcticum TaxID=1450529 RepID=A0AAN6ZGA4_9PEZI|nr:hypothetical protein BT67DRAFT_439578 [Trichocladium antarcticum]